MCQITERPILYFCCTTISRHRNKFDTGENKRKYVSDYRKAIPSCDITSSNQLLNAAKIKRVVYHSISLPLNDTTVSANLKTGGKKVCQYTERLVLYLHFFLSVFCCCCCCYCCCCCCCLCQGIKPTSKCAYILLLVVDCLTLQQHASVS